jgi:hypothetical protein
MSHRLSRWESADRKHGRPVKHDEDNRRTQRYRGEPKREVR